MSGPRSSQDTFWDRASCLSEHNGGPFKARSGSSLKDARAPLHVGSEGEAWGCSHLQSEDSDQCRESLRPSSKTGQVRHCRGDVVDWTRGIQLGLWEALRRLKRLRGFEEPERRTLDFSIFLDM